MMRFVMLVMIMVRTDDIHNGDDDYADNEDGHFFVKQKNSDVHLQIKNADCQSSPL